MSYDVIFQDAHVTILTPQERRAYEKLRRDRVIGMAKLLRLFGFGKARQAAIFLLATNVPIYKVGLRYVVFSGDVVKAFSSCKINDDERLARIFLSVQSEKDRRRNRPNGYRGPKAQLRGLEAKRARGD